MRSRLALPVLLAVPGLGLAIAGLFHPHSLTADTADRWFALHIPGVLFFPLIGVALMVLMGLRQDPLAWFVRVTAFVYATFYGALDVVSGVGAGYVTREMVAQEGAGYERAPEISLMFRIGTPLGEVGSWALIACTVAIVVDQVRRHRLLGLPSLVLVLGAYLVHVGHIFAPPGVVGMALLGLTTAYLAWVAARARENSSPAEATSAPLAASS